ncbi:uncharacterized protein [Venturia canescens]|uniref:uncharacterized protein n=1 Tax=Venturia canescens TaxID=32260 RepID=UPI001C9D0C11|nr:uncharacterized protein LOC122414847 [Venturia canescens]
MLKITSASKSAGKAGVVSQPLHEGKFLELPRSTGKTVLKPQLMKDILGPVEWEKARRSLYGAEAGVNNHVLGSSKSEGRTNNRGLGRTLQPENMKHLMESMEKMQAARQSSRVSKMEVRNQKVRRKLYSHLAPSPKPVAKNNPITRKSEMKPRKSFAVDVITMSTSVAPPRRSNLVPPNSIRDKYIRQQDIIKEELTVSIKCQSMNSTITQSDKMIYSNGKKNEEKNTDTEEITDVPVEDVEKDNIDESDELANSLTHKNIPNDIQTCDKTTKNEIVRPSVIMGISAKKLQKEQSSKSEDNEKTKNTKPNGSLNEPSRKTLSRETKMGETERLPNNNSQDISHCDISESFYRYLPQNSFLTSTVPSGNSVVSVDRETLQWIHGNLKLQVQMAEDQLFSMKRILKTFEDLIKDQEKVATEGIESLIVSKDIPIMKTDEVENMEADKENITIEKAQKSSCEIVTLEELTRIAPKAVSSSPLNECLSLEVDDQDKENKKSGEKPRRRSARLARKNLQSSSSLDDSFSSIEKELNIVHNKTKGATPVKTVSKSKVDPRCRRSVREYMALKSATNFLATPDVKGVKAAIKEKCTPSKVRSAQRDLSRKVLHELEDLYAETP